MTAPKEWTLTVTLNENGDVTVRDNRNGQEIKGKGFMLHLGDHWSGSSHNFAWGSGSSVVHAFIESMIGAKHDKAEDGDYYRYIYSYIVRNIEEVVGNLRKRGIITAEEAIQKLETDTKKSGMTH